MRIDIPFEDNTVYLVGAGSGDIKYLTLEAHSILSQAEIILYDSKLDTLKEYFSQAIWESVGKRRGFHEKRQSEINELLLKYSLKGIKVVRLKGGDVSFFARSSEEIDILQKNGIHIRLVMGISSPQLLAEALGESPETSFIAASNLGRPNQRIIIITYL